MAKEESLIKVDPNREAFQMRAQWKKADICRKQWDEKFKWLLDEREAAVTKMKQIQGESAPSGPIQKTAVIDSTKSLKPVPVTSSGFHGWLANKPECKLEIYTPWLVKVPLRLPDAWENLIISKSNSP